MYRPDRNDGGLRTSNRDHEFENFYVEQVGRLKGLALALTSNPGEADDLAQEALLRAYRSWAVIGGGDPGPYVRRTLVNLHYTSLRRKGVERKHLRVTPVETSPSPDHEVEQALLVAAALRCLSPIRRAAVVLRFYQGLPQAEIARILDRPVGTVKSDIHRALKTLRALLDDAAQPRPKPQVGRPCATG